MKISTKGTPAYQLPTTTGTGDHAGMRIPTGWEFAKWVTSMCDALKSDITATGYTVSAQVNTKGHLTITFEGDTYSRAQHPPFCITSDTKFVDKFSDLAKLDEALITKVWDDLIAFIGTLPQPGDRGFEAYMQLNAYCKELESAESKSWMDSIGIETRISGLEQENRMLMTQLDSVKTKLADAETALRVLIGIGRN